MISFCMWLAGQAARMCVEAVSEFEHAGDTQPW